MRSVRRFPLWAAPVLLSVLCPAAASADLIYYRSGETLKGLVIEEHHDRVVISTEQGESTILRKDIQDIFYDDPERNYLFIGDQALEEENFSLAQMFFRRALQIKPEFVEAQNALNRLADMKKKADSGETISDPAEVLHLRWGLELTLDIKNNLPVVQSVRDGSLAQRAGFHGGDFLVAVWGYSLAFMLPADAAALLIGPAGSPVRLTIGRRTILSQQDRALHWPGGTLEMEPLGLTVKEVDPGGVFGSAGLLPLDRIVEINGRSTRYMPLGEARKIFKEAQADVAVLLHRELLVKRE